MQPGAGGVRLYSQGTRDRTKRKYPQAALVEGVRLVTGGNVFMERLVRHWNRLPRKGAEFPSLQAFKNLWMCLVVVLAVLGEWFDSVILEGFSNLNSIC